MRSDYQIRIANQGDAATIAQHRVLMFHEMGAISDPERDAFWDPALFWIQQELAAERYIGWLAEGPQQVVGGAGIHLRTLPPGPGCMRVGRWGHIVNVYTQPDFRRQGLARRLMLELLRWCADRSLDRITLTASDQGRSLYEALGFVATSDMNLPLHRLNDLGLVDPPPIG
jgi:GNAT superfamily N-acetyltransferase